MFILHYRQDGAFWNIKTKELPETLKSVELIFLFVFNMLCITSLKVFHNLIQKYQCVCFSMSIQLFSLHFRTNSQHKDDSSHVCAVYISECNRCGCAVCRLKAQAGTKYRKQSALCCVFAQLPNSVLSSSFSRLASRYVMSQRVTVY